MSEKKEPFIAGEDRPEVKIDPDKPVSELRVRDLHAILAATPDFKLRRGKAELQLKETEERFGIGQVPPPVKQIFKEQKIEKFEIKEFKHEKNEFKEHKNELKEHKNELKEYKNEVKEHKVEKHEKPELETIPQPVFGGDPEALGVTDLAAHLGTLHQKIDELTDQIAELKKKSDK